MVCVRDKAFTIQIVTEMFYRLNEGECLQFCSEVLLLRIPCLMTEESRCLPFLSSVYLQYSTNPLTRDICYYRHSIFMEGYSQIQEFAMHSRIQMKVDSISFVQRSLEGASLAMEGERTAVSDASSSTFLR